MSETNFQFKKFVIKLVEFNSNQKKAFKKNKSIKSFTPKSGLKVSVYQGDAMTLLAFDLDPTKTENFAGFSIRVTPPGVKPYYLFNRITFSSAVLKKSGIDPEKTNINSMEFSPLQKFSWVHTPHTNHNINDWVFGKYIYEITPRYLIENVLQPLNPKLTVKGTISVTPFKKGKVEIGFTRGFVESQAYTRHFGMNNSVRPNKTDLIFDLSQKSGPIPSDKKKFPFLKDYSFEFQHTWMGWQARARIIDFLNETLKDEKLLLDVFAFDLDEPIICDSLIKLAKQDRVRIVLDNSDTHIRTTDYETKFEKLFNTTAKDKKNLVRGSFLSLAHSKVFIQKRNGKAQKILTGSTNFSTNGLCINANHVIIFSDTSIAECYEKVFEESFTKMSGFKNSTLAIQDFDFKKSTVTPDLVIRFSPHPEPFAKIFFEEIKSRISKASTDVLFAIMKDSSANSILDSVKEQVKSDLVFTYGITDTIGKEDSVFLYKPNSKRGVRVAEKKGDPVLPPPFIVENKTPGIAIHHKFIVVDFKGADPVVYCGSSNLAFGPEQNNGDNLIAIRDREIVTAFAIEAIRLVDHFQFRNRQSTAKKTNTPFNLSDSANKKWFSSYYNADDLKCLERTLFINQDKK